MLKCVTCGKEIPIGKACYPVDIGGFLNFRHTDCPDPKLEQPSDYAKPFGEVVEEEIWKGG